LALGAVLLLATGVRLWALSDRVLWFDEAVSLLIAQAPAGDVFVAVQDDTHPPLYYLVLHYWTQLLPGESGARLLSVVAGILTVAVVFALGKHLGGVTAGWLSAVLLALCPLHVWYSQEVRMYAVQTLLICLSWWLLLRARWVAYVFVTALGLYTQYTTAFAIAAQIVYVAISQRQLARPFAYSLAGVAVLFAPWAGIFWHHWHGQTFGYWLRAFEWADPVRFFGLLSGAMQKQTTPYWPWAAISMVALIVAGRTWRRASGMWLWLVLPVAALTVLSLRQNVFLPRSIVFVAPAFALLVGGAAATGNVWARGAAGLVVGANLVALANYYWQPNLMTKSSLRVAAQQVAAAAQPGDLVVHTSRFTYRSFQVYLGDRVRQGLEQETEEMPALFRVIGDSRLPVNWIAAPRIWLVTCADFQRRDAGNILGAVVSQTHDYRQQVLADAWMQVELYVRRAGLNGDNPPLKLPPNRGIP
jgi:4-amino-4-deoxy-L-arabinose transferase-like glycosyltransferase